MRIDSRARLTITIKYPKILKKHPGVAKALGCAYPSYILAVAATKYGVSPADVKTNLASFSFGISNLKDIFKRVLVKSKN